jgi:hypothetical protein
MDAMRAILPLLIGAVSTEKPTQEDQKFLKKQNNQDNENQSTESFQDNNQETGKFLCDRAQDENQSICDTSHVHTKAALLEPINKNKEKNVGNLISQDDGPKPREDILSQEKSKPEACQ